MKALRQLSALLIVFFAVSAGTAGLYGFSYEESVVQVRVTVQEFDYFSPWQRKRHSVQTLHGCVIRKNPGLIVTLSLPLENHVYIEVMKFGRKRRYPAEVVLKDYKTGLAFLTAENQHFFDDLAPAGFSEEPVRLSKGVVVRWDASGRFKQYQTEVYEHSIQSYEGVGGALIHQMITGLDAGGDGEPVFQENILTGLNAWFDRDRKIIKVISSETLKWMLEDYRDGKYEGQAFFLIQYHGMDGDENLKRYLGLRDDEEGVYITDVAPVSSGRGIIIPGDVIVSIDGFTIDDTGFCTFPLYGKLNFKWVVFSHFTGDEIEMEIVRKRKRMTIRFELVPETEDSLLVPSLYQDEGPRFYIAGGFVFQELSRGYLRIWGGDWEKQADKRLVHLTNAAWGRPSETRRRIVILNRVLPSESNSGYHEKANLILESINDTEIRDLQHVLALLESCREEFIVFGFQGNETVVIGKKTCFESTETILRQYGIPVRHNLD
ncbi:MAG: hypothetical protein JW881_07420 [Spirochaetales bacterium]|nr:hypothetical protein [Spirochaetales bacterium]